MIPRILIRHHRRLRLRQPSAMFSSSSTATNKDGIVSIGINNPQRRNALSSQVLESLQQQLAKAKADASCKVIILKGQDSEIKSNGVFCSGHDLTELRQQPDENTPQYQQRMTALFRLCSRVMMELSTFPVPTICQVDGIATAAGCQLVASCDLAVATSASRFATPGVHIGLFCSTPAVPLVRSVASRKHAMEMLLTGDLISAQRAYEIGLINRVVDVGKDGSESVLQEEVQQLASKIASKSTSCIRVGLQTLRQQQSASSLAEAYAMAECTMVNNLLSDDAVEGIGAFLEKRTPHWKK